VSGSDDGRTLPLLATTTTLTVRYSLISDNTGTDLAEAPVGMPDANGNLIGDPNGMGVIDPLLAPLADNGGPTQTHALLPGSPAIDAGDPSFAPPPVFDQRSDPFDRVFGGRIDMGAYERQTGDMDFDGDIDFDDIDGFAFGLAFSLDYEQQYGAPSNANGDTDGDGDLDFDDIPGFVAILGGDSLVGPQAVGESVPAVQRVDVVANVDVPAFTSLPLRSATIGPWLTAAVVHREFSDQDTASRSSRTPAAEEATHRILDRVLTSRDELGQQQRRALSRVRPTTVQGDSEKPPSDELAAVWADDWDWLGRRPP